MTLNFRFEPLSYLLNTGLAELGERSWSEIGNDKQTFQYDPDWHQYERLQQQDILRFFAVRDDAELLVGYASVLVMHSLHDKKVLCAIIQDIYLEPEHRNGLESFRKFEQTLEGLLKGIGVKHISIAERENDQRGGVGEVYRRLGFNSCERIWTKSL
jgi:hypothetical protein